MRRATGALARRLGCTEGQVQTVAIGAVIALLTAVLGLPPVLRERAVGDVVDDVATGTRAGAASAAANDIAVNLDAAREVAAAIGATPRREPPSIPPAVSAPETRPSLTVAGVHGTCGIGVRSIDNPRHPDGEEPTPVWIYEPSGATSASVAGGRCDDSRRPVVFIAHGFGQTDPTSYQELIRHFVSIGNIVVFPVYNVGDGERRTLEESYRVVDAGLVAAMKATSRVDATRTGWWGHSHGGGMIPYLVQQAANRHWGERAMWLSIVAQAYTQLVGAEDIAVPRRAEEMSVAFQNDALADARLGIDVYKSLLLPADQKRHVTVHTDPASGFVAEHGAPTGGNGLGIDAVDTLLWRYADLLQLCAVHGVGCDADLTRDSAGTARATVSDKPLDVGPYPAILAECDAGYGPSLNPRIARCGETRVTV